MMRAIDLLSLLADRWWLWILHAGWQIALVATVVLAVLFFGKRLSSPLRHGLLLVALVKFLVPPFCALPTGALSYFSIAAHENASPTILAPSISRSSQSLSTEPPELTADDAADSTVSPGQSLSGLVNQSRAERQFESDSWSATPVESPLSDAVAAADPSALLPQKARYGNDRAQSPTWRIGGMLLHLAGSTFFAFVLVRRSWVLRAMIQAGEPFSAAQQQSIERHWSSSRPVPCGVIVNENVLPFSYGIRLPVVVLPRQVIEQCTAAEVDTIILHEVVHHRRHDLIVVILQAVVAVVWWFHPVMWLVQRQLEAAREDCCDDTLLGLQGVVPSAYAQLLLTVARLSAVRRVAGPSLAAGMPRYSQLRLRVIRIMEDALPRRYQLSKIGLGILMMVCALVWPGLRATGDATAEQTPAQPSAAQLPAVPSEPNRAEKEQAISGRVVQADGTPLAGARIWLGPAVSGVFDMLTSTSLSSWYAETDADGSYTFAKPPWAQSQLHNRPSCVVWCVGPNKELIVKPIVDVHDPDVGMIAFRPSERCRVKVFSQDGMTAETATVAPASIVIPGPLRMHFHVPMEVREACSMECQIGSSVEFRFARGMSGFAMAVSAARFGTLESYAEPTGTDRKIALRPTGAVAGRVELPAGASYDLSRLKIFAATRINDSASRSGAMSDYGRAIVQVDAEGRFTVPAIAEGTLSLRVVVPPDCPYRTARLTDYAISADKTVDVDIALKQCIRVHGSILDAATKQPIPGAIARLAQGDQQSAIDDRGEFTLWMLPQSTDTIDYDIPAEYYFRQRDTLVRVGNRDDVTLAPLRLPRAKVLRGIVRDTAGNSLPGLGVLINYNSLDDAFDGTGMGVAFQSRQRTTSDADGRFELLGLPPDTPMTIAVLRHGIVLAQRQVHPADDRELVLVTRDFDAVSLNGRIVMPPSISTDNLRATLQYCSAGTDGVAGAVFAQTLELDSEGRFKTAAEYPREFDYRVEVYHVDRSILASGWVAPGDEPIVQFPELVLTPQMISVATRAEKPTLEWHGTVETTDGKPIPNATVTAWHSARHAYRHTDSNGEFEFDDVSLGGGWLIAQADGYHCDGHFVFNRDRQQQWRHLQETQYRLP